VHEFDDTPVPEPVEIPMHDFIDFPVPEPVEGKGVI
jgi:hypothetical protein